MTIWHYSQTVGGFVFYILGVSYTDKKYHPLLFALSWTVPLLSSEVSWEECAIQAGTGYIIGLAINQLNQKDEQWDQLNEQFKENSEHFNLQLQEKEVGNNWILVSRHHELIGNFEERESASLTEFNSLLTQLSDKEQEIEQLKNKINLSINFTNEEKQVLESLKILHRQLKVIGEEKIKEIKKLNEELEIEQDHAQVMDKWYRENIVKELQQRNVGGSSAVNQVSRNWSSQQRRTGYFKKISNPWYYLKHNGTKCLVIFLGIQKATNYLTESIRARQELENLQIQLRTKIILTDEEREIIILLVKENGLVRQLPLDHKNKEKMTEFSTITESIVPVFINQRNKYPYLGSIIDTLLWLARDVKVLDDWFEKTNKDVEELIKKAKEIIETKNAQIEDLEEQLEISQKQQETQIIQTPSWKLRG